MGDRPVVPTLLFMQRVCGVLKHRLRRPAFCSWFLGCCVAVVLLLALSFSGNAQEPEDPEMTVLSLQKAIETAVQNSPLLKTAAEEERASQAVEQGSRAALWPRLDLNASYLKENQAIPYIPAQAIDIPAKFSDEVYAWGVFLKFPLYEGGRLVGQIKVAELERMAQGLLKEMTLQDLISNVSNTFNKCLQMEALVQAYGLSVEALRKAREDMDARFRLGRVPQVEMLRMDVQLSAEEQNLVRAQEGLRRARNALAYFMGIETSKLGSLKGGLEAKERVAAADISHLVQARPDVSALTQRLQAERARLEVTKAKRYPSIGLVSDYGNRAGTGIRDREEVWEAGVVASVNLFDGGVISSEIARQQAVVAKAEEALRAGVLRATKEIEDALSSVREAEARIGLAENAVLQAKEALRIEELRYKTGASSITDFLLAQSAFSLAEAGRLQALYDYTAAVIEFKRATGSLSAPNTQASSFNSKE